MGMDSSGIRVIGAVIFLAAFLVSYSWILHSFNIQNVSPDEREMILIRTYSLKVMVFSAYCVTNSLMIATYKSRIEYELLLTGVFSIIFITVTSALHYSHVLIMTKREVLIRFNLLTVLFFLIVAKNFYLINKLKT